MRVRQAEDRPRRFVIQGRDQDSRYARDYGALDYCWPIFIETRKIEVTMCVREHRRRVESRDA